MFLIQSFMTLKTGINLFAINQQDILYFISHKQTLVPYLVIEKLQAVNDLLIESRIKSKETLYSLKASILDKLGIYETHDTYYLPNYLSVKDLFGRLIGDTNFANLILLNELKQLSKRLFKGSNVNRFFVPSKLLKASTLEEFDDILASYIPLFGETKQGKGLKQFNSYLFLSDYSRINTAFLNISFLEHIKEQLGSKVIVLVRDIVSLLNKRFIEFIDLAILSAQLSYIPYPGFFVFIKKGIVKESNMRLVNKKDELFPLYALDILIDNVKANFDSIKKKRAELNNLFISLIDKYINVDVTNPLLVPFNILNAQDDRFITVFSISAEFGDFLKRNASHSRVFIDINALKQKRYRFVFSLGLYNNKDDVKDLVEYVRVSAHMLGLV